MNKEKILLEHVDCDLCGENDYLVRYRKPDTWLWINQFEYPVVECRNCGLVYVNPRPTQESMTQFYANNYHDNRDNDQSLERYKKQIEFIPTMTKESILDIGCARGDFLTFLKNKYPNVNVFGCDYYSDYVNDNRIDFKKASLPECNYADESFDIITAWAVFEHLHQPSVYFSEVNRILKYGGKCIFLVTNSESLYGRKAYLEDVPRHTYHFSRPILEKYAQKCGFNLTKCIYSDELFDGRGMGTFNHLLGRLFGVSWKQRYSSQYKIYQKIALKIGALLDKIVFSIHWESRLKRSGIMIVEFEKQQSKYR